MQQLNDPRLLADYIRLRGTNGAQLAVAVGVTRQFISQLCNGHRNGCSDDTALRIEAELRAPQGSLFREMREVRRRVSANAA